MKEYSEINRERPDSFEIMYNHIQKFVVSKIYVEKFYSAIIM